MMQLLACTMLWWCCLVPCTEVQQLLCGWQLLADGHHAGVGA
jgi:hypothetical protein